MVITTLTANSAITQSTSVSFTPVPTPLVRVLNAGNELEIYKYPSIGDKLFFQNRYSDIRERVGREGQPFLIITTETNFTN